MSSAPVECLIVEFPGNRFSGKIAPALAELTASGTIRIIDLVFIKKDAGGAVTKFKLEELDRDEASGFDNVAGAVGGLLTADDIEAAAANLDPNSSAALLVWENTWAARFAGAVREAGGVVKLNLRLPKDAVAGARAATP